MALELLRIELDSKNSIREAQGQPDMDLYANAKHYGIIALVLVGVFIAGFLMGYLPLRSELEQLQAQNAKIEEQNASWAQSLKITNLRGAAGLMSYRISHNNYGAVAELSTGFFNGLREAIQNTTDETLRQNLQALLQQRDEIIAGLAQADPAVKETLAQIYVDFFQIRGAA